MNDISIISNSLIIKETIGFAIFDDIPVKDHPAIINFCKIVFNYMKMIKLENKIIS